MTPPPARLPDGFAVRLAADVVRRHGGRTLVGGSPRRLLHLRPAAVGLLDGDRVTVREARSAALARLLLDRGVADPDLASLGGLPGVPAACDVTVVVPVRDRPDGLTRLLRALDPALPVVVVDDGSATPVVGPPHVQVVRHRTSRGPAAARNSGLARVRTPLVAFVDSDVVPDPGWLDGLLGHFADPAVAAVAPRVAPLESGGSWLARYEAVRSPLDLGPAPASVVPRGRVAYVPAACLITRVADVSGLGGFDAGMPVGEDVDLVWRLVAAGRRVRYEPAALVRHEHRTTTAGWLSRRAAYGSSAGPLGRRHGDAVAPVVMTPWTAVLLVAALAQRWWSLPVAAGAWAIATVRLARALHRYPDPLRTAAALIPYAAVGALWQGAAGALRHWWPAAALACVVSRRARRAVALAAIAEGLADRRRTRAELDPARYVLARRLDDLAYGAGVWWGAARGRTLAPLRPVRARR